MLEEMGGLAIEYEFGIVQDALGRGKGLKGT